MGLRKPNAPIGSGQVTECGYRTPPAQPQRLRTAPNPGLHYQRGLVSSTGCSGFSEKREMTSGFQRRVPARVVRRDGEIWLLEHVRIDRPIAGAIMDALNPLVVRMMGANINRQTVEDVKLAGLNLLEAADLRGQLVKLIHARSSRSHAHRCAGFAARPHAW